MFGLTFHLYHLFTLHYMYLQNAKSQYRLSVDQHCNVDDVNKTEKLQVNTMIHVDQHCDVDDDLDLMSR